MIPPLCGSREKGDRRANCLLCSIEKCRAIDETTGHLMEGRSGMDQFLKTAGLQIYHSAPVYLLRACHAKLFGSIQKQEMLALLPRPAYAYGMMRAAEWARDSGLKAVTVCEFGMASGDGLAAMVDLAARLGPEMGVRFRVCGFDGGVGLPKPRGFKDHPEIWKEGAFLMPDPDALKQRFAGKAEIFWGDIAHTVEAFNESLTPEAPLGFVSVDVDQYGSAVAVLRCLDSRPECLHPRRLRLFRRRGVFHELRLDR